MISPTQSRMARAALNWSVTDLSERSGIDPDTIERFEAGEDIAPDPSVALRDAFEAQRVVFLMNGTLAGGVVPPKPRPSAGRINPSIERLMRG